MLSFEQKAKDYYGEITINKGLFRQAGFGGRAIPAAYLVGGRSKERLASAAIVSLLIMPKQN